MKTHKLKTVTRYFADILSGEKTADMRYTEDRDFEVGDVLELNEYDPSTDKFSGRSISATITHIFDDSDYGVMEGFVMISFRRH